MGIEQYSASAKRLAYDAIIVGNGAVGLFLGLELASRGLAVAVIGEAGRAFSASAAAGAMLGCYGEVGPTTFDTPFGRTKFELDRLAAERWPAVIGQLSEVCDGPDGEHLIAASGTVLIHNTIGHPLIDDKAMSSIRGALDANAESYESVDPADLEWLDPQPTARPLQALYLPNENAVNSGRILNALECALVRTGGQLIDATVRALVSTHGAISSVELSDGTLLATSMVTLAAGVRSQQLLDSFPDVARTIPRLVSGPGIAAVIDERSPVPNLGHVVRTPNRAFACGLHAVPRADGLVYLGATNAIRPTPTDAPSVRGLQFLLDCAVRQLRRGIWLSDIRSVIVGNRPVTLDGYPLFGPTTLDGLWLLTGTYRDGFHTAPVLATLMADWLTAVGTSELLQIFNPIRKPIQAMNRDETIEQAVVHRLATGHEFDWSLPVEWPTVMESLFRNYYNSLASSIDDEYTPPPDILSFIPRYPELAEFLQSYYSSTRS